MKREGGKEGETDSNNVRERRKTELQRRENGGQKNNMTHVPTSLAPSNFTAVYS